MSYTLTVPWWYIMLDLAERKAHEASDKKESQAQEAEAGDAKHAGRGLSFTV